MDFLPRVRAYTHQSSARRRFSPGGVKGVHACIRVPEKEACSCCRSKEGTCRWWWITLKFGAELPFGYAGDLLCRLFCPVWWMRNSLWDGKRRCRDVGFHTPTEKTPAAFGGWCTTRSPLPSGSAAEPPKSKATVSKIMRHSRHLTKIPEQMRTCPSGNLGESQHQHMEQPWNSAEEWVTKVMEEAGGGEGPYFTQLGSEFTFNRSHSTVRKRF